MAEIVVSVLSGLLAGFGTGFAGLSAAVFIAPMLSAFLGVDSFSSIGIALASDVLASAASALAYQRHGNIDLKRSRVLFITVLAFAVLGSIVSHLFTGLQLGESVMGWWLIAATLILGLKLLIFPSKSDNGLGKKILLPEPLLMFLCGAYIGFVCGFQGTGGGLMLLFVLNILIGLEFKKAVGTSVCIMAFTALIGAISHFTLRGIPDLKLLILCISFTLIGAGIAALIANRIPSVLLKRITGGLMAVSGIAMIIFNHNFYF